MVPELKEVLLDPIPDVRTVSAKAIASLIAGVGEIELPDLIPWYFYVFFNILIFVMLHYDC